MKRLLVLIALLVVRQPAHKARTDERKDLVTVTKKVSWGEVKMKYGGSYVLSNSKNRIQSSR